MQKIFLNVIELFQVLTLGTLVIETAITGGAMQTARLALDQNREVFAIPGNLGVKQSEGTNILIQRGEAELGYKCRRYFNRT